MSNAATTTTNNTEGRTMKLPKHIEFWDVEPGFCYGDPQTVIVTLNYGFSFDDGVHAGVRGFDGIAEAKYESARKRIYDCTCDECKKHLETDTTTTTTEGSTMTTTTTTEASTMDDRDREFAGGIADAIMDAIYETCRGNDVPVDAMTAIGREALRQASERNG